MTNNSFHLSQIKAPAKFFRNKTAKELISELENQTGQICLVSSEGKSGGTFAHELLAVSYAGWSDKATPAGVAKVILESGYQKGGGFDVK
ncbi:KilA-N domain-containing protein [Xenorhabdus cabanillasii]|uniref:KilA-N domain-containing protein n=1 Tax=Xenorhabdus cabanillasii JM26 TaxID=1427517 RepID=W1J939_9GAMM|nr:KilA-N domain-containing protein [Xenorhabdus cabanillasii]PHM75268.1 hypothetical protein Xcab_04260 [Xenorhabdus cabanillasii JM26]CDL86381.1 hypothetical protein XCR1_3150002 [Xenorhabdus cabanillasii JM26]